MLDPLCALARAAGLQWSCRALCESAPGEAPVQPPHPGRRRKLSALQTGESDKLRKTWWEGAESIGGWRHHEE